MVFLDTETTGLFAEAGDRLVEIACVEAISRRLTGRELHHLLDPGCPIDAEASLIHGIHDKDVRGAPRFGEVADEILAFIDGADVVMHNAEFDLRFLDTELAVLGRPRSFSSYCTVIDSLAIARQLHPRQANSLDALCRRYQIDLSARSEHHGALLDARLLASVFLSMTSGQETLHLASTLHRDSSDTGWDKFAQAAKRPLVILRADPQETEKHRHRMEAIHSAHLKALKARISQLRESIRESEDKLRKPGIRSTERRKETRNLMALLRSQRTQLQLSIVQLGFIERRGPGFL